MVAAGDGKAGSRQPALLGRNRRIELATKQQNVRNSANKKFEERGFLTSILFRKFIFMIISIIVNIIAN